MYIIKREEKFKGQMGVRLTESGRNVSIVTNPERVFLN